MGIVPSSSARIKNLVGANSKKVSGMQEVRDILLKSPIKQLKICDLPCKKVADNQSSSRLCRFEDQTERTVPLLGNHDSSVKPRTIKCGADSILQAAVERARELSARAKSPPIARTAGPGVGDSSARDERMSDLFNANFLSSPSTCAKLVNHIH